MTDPSVPLQWPQAQPGNASAEAAPQFEWPTPPFAAYPRPRPQREPQACEIMGLNGSRTVGKVILDNRPD